MYSFAPSLPAYQKIGPAFLAAMEEAGLSTNNLHLEYLDLLHLKDDARRRDLAQMLRYKYAGTGIDMIVAFHAPAMTFLLNEAGDLFPDVPVLAWNVGEAFKKESGQRRLIRLSISLDPQGTLKRALELFPETKQVVFVTGVSQTDKYLESQVKAVFADWESRLHFEYTSEDSVEEILARVAHLPPRTIVIYGNLFQDRTGRTFTPRDVGEMVAEAANAPVFVLYDTLMGRGVVGGSLLSFAADGAWVGRVALDILNGKIAPGGQKAAMTSQTVPMFDWPEIAKWGGNAAKLSEEAIFINRIPSILDRYRWYILAFLGILLGQLVLIASLVIQKGRRKKAEEAVKVERQRFNDVLEALPVFLVLLTPDYHIPFANRLFRERFGEPDGKRCFEHLFGRKEPCDTCETFTVLKTNTPCHCQWTAPDGRKYEIHDFPFNDVDGAPLIMEMGIDITARKQAEAAVQAERKRLFDVLETLPTMICLLTPDYRVAFANKSFRQKFGESDGRRCYDYCFGRSEPCDLCESYKVLETGRPHHWEVETPEGRIIDAYDYPFTDADGSPLVLEMNIDITEQKHAETALKALNENLEVIIKDRTAELSKSKQQLELHLTQLQAILDSLSEGLVVADLSSRLFRWNPAAVTMHGFTGREEGLRRLPDFDDIFELSTLEGVVLRLEEWPLARILRGEVLHECEVQIRRKACNWQRTFSYGGRLALDAEGNPLLAIVTISDITERKQAEESLLQLNETLEKRVAERTALAENRSRQLQSLAVELIEAEERERRRFAHLLHDDLQQLLAAAKLQLDALSGTLPRESTLPYVSHLLEEAIGKSRRLSHELSPAVLQYPDFSAALNWLSGQMRDQFGLHVQLEADNDHCIESAPIRRFFFRSVQELLFNIVKHAEVKNAIVRLARTDGWFKVIVEDKGRGFDPCAIETMQKSGGFGLLSMRERASYIGGSLEVDSEPGRGSRIVLTVPVEMAKAGKVQKHQSAQDIPASGKRSADGADVRILLADDHKVMRQGLIRLIGGQPGIQVVGEAANGREALEMARQFRPDIVVMDISMPEMNGIEATRRIRSEMPDVHVVGLSMHDEVFLLQAMREAGAGAFVTKAASSAELLEAIYKACSEDSNKPHDEDN
ncbi:MAG: response regulator [Desulfosarcinaceae bacterium]